QVQFAQGEGLRAAGAAQLETAGAEQQRGGEDQQQTVRHRTSSWTAPALPGRLARLVGDDVDQLAGHHDHLANRQAFSKAQDVLVGAGGGLHVLAAGAGRYLDLATQLAVDLDRKSTRL